MMDISQVDLSFHLTRLDAVVVRTKIGTPVRTSFGVMHNRPTLLVRVTDQSGAVGYGEVWCNFPVCGAQHRQQLLLTEIAPRVTSTTFEQPQACYEAVTKGLHILRLQTGEIGPIAQVIAGLDIAVLDMVARRAGLPVYALLGSDRNRVPAYASGINPDGVLNTVAQARRAGHKAFKIKVGFGEGTDRRNVEAVASARAPDEAFMLDANQGWSPEAALRAMEWIAPCAPRWVEEPMPVDVPAQAWHSLKNATSVPIAGAENFATRGAYDKVVAEKWLDIVQPDIAKWGGFTECLPVARAVVGAGLTFCPHSLGGGVALAASAHLLAAAGGPGLLECDVNENSFRDAVFPLALEDGTVTLPDLPGLGVRTDILDEQFG